MLETKRVISYGKRSTRIIYFSNDNRTSHCSPIPKHRINGENTASISPCSTRVVLSRGRKVHGLSTSPRGSPKSSNIIGLASKKPPDRSKGVTPKRRPFGLKNVVPSPSIVYLGQRSTRTSNAKLDTFAPFVDSDIILIEERNGENMGCSKNNNRRSYLPQQRVDDEEVEVIRPSRRRVVKKPIVVSEDEDDNDKFTPKQSRLGAKVNPIVISDNENDNHSVPPSHLRVVHDVAPLEEPRPLPKGSSRRLQAKVSVQTTKLSSVLKQSRGKDISLPTIAPAKSTRSPRRSHRNAPRLGLTEAHKPPPSASNLERSFAALSITGAAHSHPQYPQHLAPLLAECAQTAPHCFSTFVETFPFNDLHENNSPFKLTFRKIGEASYSEVFAIGNVVLKIIPLRDESCVAQQQDTDVDMPQESDSKDVLQEVIVTRAMGQVCSGFIKLLRTYVVVGKYPSSLLSLWDHFNDSKSSENVRPDIFPPTQAYALLVLPHGGPDLEAYNFPIKIGWRQACSIFWQTTRALATAEELVSFEHRDLHWGQILVKSSISTRKNTPRPPGRHGTLDTYDANVVAGITMDHPSHGVTATIIDLGLARMDARDGNSSRVHWTPFDDLIFEGEGDYQFDVYRMMRHIHGHGAWDRYCPLTNVMWLHYLTLKLLRSKRLRPPGLRNASITISGFNEKQCYECLVEMEQLLANSIPQLKGKKYRGTTKGIFSQAGEVLHFAKGKGWLQ